MTFVNTYTRDTGTLTISKAVAVNPETESGSLNDKTFQVTVRNGEGKYLQSVNPISFADTAPATPLTVSVSSGLIINNLPTDTYTVEEVLGTNNINVQEAGYRYDGTSYSLNGGEASETASGIEVNKDDTSAVTITNNYTKLYTVTVIKNVTGTDADKEAMYSFTQTGLTGESSFDLRGSDDTDTSGVIDNRKVFNDVPYGTAFSVTEDAGHTDFDTAIVIINNGVQSNVAGKVTPQVTVNGDVTVTYTNTRNKQQIKVFKYETGTSPEKPLAGAVFSLQGPEGTGILYANLTTNGDGYLVNDSGIIFSLPVNDEPYILTETQAPAGYLVNGNGVIQFSVTADRVIGPDVEQETSSTEGAPTGVFLIKVQNSAGVVLPSTGGSGRSLIYLLGILLTGIAGAGLIWRKRRKAAYVK